MSRFSPVFSRALVVGLIGAFGFINFALSSKAEDQNLFRTYKPLTGFSVSLGSKRMVGYYESDTGVCKITFLVAPDMRTDELPLYTPVRFIQNVEPGRMAVVDTPEGKTLEFGCRPRAEAMTLRTLNLVAGYKPFTVR
ncbi:MAG: hypothetical protein ACKOW3_00455 [Hyphomicrobium sp.]